LAVTVQNGKARCVPVCPPVERTKILRSRRKEVTVSRQSRVIAALGEPTCVEKLAELFPGASPVRIPVRVSALSAGRRRLQERTIIEFGTASEVLFASTLPLEFEDRVRLANSDGSFNAAANVVAVRYHDGRKAVAARFIGEVENWIIKP